MPGFRTAVLGGLAGADWPSKCPIGGIFVLGPGHYARLGIQATFRLCLSGLSPCPDFPCGLSRSRHSFRARFTLYFWNYDP